MSAQNNNSRFVRTQPEVKKAFSGAATATPPSTPLAQVVVKHPKSLVLENERIPTSTLKLSLQKKVTDYNLIVCRCLLEAREITDIDSFEDFRQNVRSFVGDQTIRMNTHAFGKQLVTATTRAPQFFVSHFPFYTNGPIQGTTNFPIREAEMQAFFDQVFVHELHVELKLNQVQTLWVAASNAQANHILYQGSENTAQSTTLTTAFYDGLCSGRKVWATPLFLSAASSNEKAPSMKLTIPSPYSFSRDSKGWYGTSSGTGDFARIHYTSDTATSADTDIIGSVLAVHDCSFRIRYGG
jgi:hypothetical protein